MPRNYLTIHATVTAEACDAIEAAIDALLAPVRPGLTFLGTFTLGLSANGLAPPTHYGTTALVLEEDLVALLLAAPAFEGAVALATTEADTGAPQGPSVDALATTLGLVRVAYPPI